ncbi:flagellar motor switch protein FliG [Parvularcula maris]|uniref:Flagellar motor switch protein FliG n=1 Tax=Parvularcula maris TaxID=2965077 RepID=A0A9X2L9D3_9PROT|nr:flagellar motor switch protein FliG [Parvularcula maris]MCQ8185528.1 flagellar motor switch protein FliG [Parvularcula maris]
MPTVKIRNDVDALSGPEKVAVMLLTLGEEQAGPLLERMDDSEVRIITRSMATLGSITGEVLEELIRRFTSQFSQGGSVIGSADSTERMLRSFLPADRVVDIMNYIRGPGGASTWEKIAMVDNNMLAKYLNGEHPQTIAVVLSKVDADQAAHVLANLPEKTVPDVMKRMISMNSVPKEVLADIEEMLQRDLMLNYQSSQETNNLNHMAEIFNRTETERSDQLLEYLKEQHEEEVFQIKQLMFTFDDLMELDPHSLRTVIRSCESDTLTYALKGCDLEVRNKIVGNLSERARTILLDNMDTLGPVLMRDVEAAKATMVRKAKELAEAGVIVIERGGESQMVY